MFITKENAIQWRQYLLKQAEALKQQREAILSQVSMIEKEFQIGKEKSNGPSTEKSTSQSPVITG